MQRESVILNHNIYCEVADLICIYDDETPCSSCADTVHCTYYNEKVRLSNGKS